MPGNDGNDVAPEATRTNCTGRYWRRETGGILSNHSGIFGIFTVICWRQAETYCRNVCCYVEGNLWLILGEPRGRQRGIAVLLVGKDVYNARACFFFLHALRVLFLLTEEEAAVGYDGWYFSGTYILKVPHNAGNGS